MKTSVKTIVVCVAFLVLGAGSARASSYDFLDHNNNNYSNDGKSGKGDNDSDWSSGDKSDGGDNYKYKSGGYSSPGDNSSWSDGGSHDGDDRGGKNDDGDKYKDGKGDAPPPPQCAAADPGHDKWGGDGKGDKSGEKGSSGWGDDGGGDKWGHNYYKNICDKDPGKGHPGHHRCDPGDPAPLPASLPLFAAAVGLLALRKKAHGRFAK